MPKTKATPVAAATVIVEIAMDAISPSSFSTQFHRRNKFTDEALKDLSDSIKHQGLINPITVRQQNWQVVKGRPSKGQEVWDLFNPDLDGGTTRHTAGYSKEKVEALAVEASHEIICGERRFRAAKLAGLSTIPCIIKNLNDNDALEVQIQENLQRVDVEPLDEAFFYKFLFEKRGYSIADLSVKFQKNEKFIHQRLKLNDLIPEALKEIEKGLLPLGHALELSKYPAESQKTALKENWQYQYKMKDYGVLKLAEFKKKLADGFALKLADAPFKTDDDRLHPEHLLCSQCPDQTGYAPNLFAEDFSKKDSCLKRSCYMAKTTRHFELIRDEIAVTRPNPEDLPAAEVSAKVPLVSETWIGVSEKPLKTADYVQNVKFRDAGECEFLESALSIYGKKKGQTVLICRDESCPTHAAGTASGPNEWELKRLERDFAIAIHNEARTKIFLKAVEMFDTTAPFWAHSSFLVDLLWQLVSDRSYKIRNYQSITKLFGEFSGSIDDWKDEKSTRKFLKDLDVTGVSRLLFLLLNIEVDHWSYEPGEPKEILVIAKKYTNLDYKTLSAEAMVELAPDEFKPIAQQFLEDTKAGLKPETPHFWYTEPKTEQEKN